MLKNYEKRSVGIFVVTSLQTYATIRMGIRSISRNVTESIGTTIHNPHLHKGDLEEPYLVSILYRMSLVSVRACCWDARSRRSLPLGPI